MTGKDSAQAIITVLHICEHFGNEQVSFHGVARLFQLWIPSFDKKRFRVLLCSRQGPCQASRVLEESGIQPLYLGYHKLDPRNLVKLMGIIHREKVDIMHAHGYGACLWARLAGHILRKPVIVHEHCNYGTVPVFQRPVEWVLGRWTKCAFAVSESVRVFTYKKRYIPERNVHLLYSGIPLEGIPMITAEWRQTFRREQAASDRDIIIGVVGRLESHKGHIDAFVALDIVRKKHPTAYLWVIGDGRFQEELTKWVHNHNMEDAVRFLGYRRNVLELIQCLDIQLFPSHQEGTPSTLFESMAVGNVAVASTADGQGEVLEDGRTGLLFEPGDTARMAQQLIRVIEEPELRKRMKADSMKAIRNYDMRVCLETMEKTYESMVKRV